jgi:hypothetical protein
MRTGLFLSSNYYYILYLPSPDSPESITKKNYGPKSMPYQTEFKYCWKQQSGNAKAGTLSKAIFQNIDTVLAAQGANMQGPNSMSNAYAIFLTMPPLASTAFGVGIGLLAILFMTWLFMNRSQRWNGLFTLELKIMPVMALIWIPFYICLVIMARHILSNNTFVKSANWSPVWPGCNVNVIPHRLHFIKFALIFTPLYALINTYWYYDFRYRFGWGLAAYNATCVADNADPDHEHAVRPRFNAQLVDELMRLHPKFSSSEADACIEEAVRNVDRDSISTPTRSKSNSAATGTYDYVPPQPLDIEESLNHRINNPLMKQVNYDA